MSALDRRGESNILKWFGIVVLAPSLVVILLANLALKDDSGDDPQRRIENALACGNHAIAKLEYRKLAQQEPRNLEWHRGYIRAHLQEPKVRGKRQRRNDGPILAEYRAWSASPDPEIADAGWYGLGYFHSIENDYEQALACFNRVRNRALPYLNNSAGYASLQLGETERAEAYFRREIEIGDHVEGAFSNLGRLLHDAGRYDELVRLTSDPRARQALDQDILRHLSLRAGRYGRYVLDATHLLRATPLGLLGAALVFIVWFLYLRRIDIFERERMTHAGLMTMGSMAFSLLVVPLYDLLEFGLNFKLTGRPLNDLAFCILGIGFVEELIKVLPVLVALKFTRVIDESVDYIVYASLSGVGFAFMENLLYFGDSGLGSIFNRGFSASILHMILTSLVMYGMLYGRRSGEGAAVFRFALAFAAACAVHGIYDYWLVSGGWIGELSVLSFLILIFAISTYGRILNTALNLSEFIPPRHDPLLNLTRRLCASLAAVVMLQYLILAARYGASNANRNLLVTVVSSYTLILVILGSLGRFTISKGAWVPLFARARR